MYFFLTKIESLIMNIKIFFQKLYYKIKYGKRLSLGSHVKFRKGFKIVIGDKGYVKIGDNCFFNQECTIDCNQEIIIGKHNLFGENVKIYDHNHVFNNKKVDFGINFKNYTIKIADENWFGTGVIILGNTIIGNNNVVGANTVVKGVFKNDSIIQNISSKHYEIQKINYKG